MRLFDLIRSAPSPRLSEAGDKRSRVDSTRGSVTGHQMNLLTNYGYWNVAQGEAVIMANAPSLLGATLAVAFKYWDYA